MRSSEAAQALAAAVEALGGRVQQLTEGAIRVTSPRGRVTTLEPVPASKLSAGTIPHVSPDPEARVVPVLVADLITAPVRDELATRGLSWFDRRGHLRLWADDLWVDADVPPAPRATQPRRTQEISGRAQISVAVAHLLGMNPGVRALARRVGLSAGAVSKARAKLVETGLLARDGDPTNPELFWAVAEAWTVDWFDLAHAPPHDDGLVLVGATTAARLGAPIVVTEDWPPDLLARDSATVGRARLRGGGPATGPTECRVGLSPTPLVADPALVTFDHEIPFPIAHPLFAALELAQDPGRGTEALEQWHPTEFDRVW